MKFNRQYIILFALCIVAALMVSACSSDGGSATDQPNTGQTTTEPSPTDTPVSQPATEGESDAATTEDTTEEPAPAEQNAGPADVVATLVNRGNFSQLVAAIQAAGLEEKLSAAGPYTIFAPTDDAFAAVSPDVLNNGDLVYDILLYHVVEGSLSSGDVAAQSFMTTLLGDDMGVSVDGSNVRLDGALITERDIQATNGVVHVIDSVLIPPSSGLLDSSRGASVAMK